MSYDFWMDGEDEPRFSDTHPAFDGDGMAGNVLLSTKGYTRCGNYTSNVSPIWARCLTAVQATGEEVRLADLEGQKGGDILPHLTSAVEWGIAHLDELREMNPPNGWGSAEGAVTYLWDIQRACEAHPQAELRLSR